MILTKKDAKAFLSRPTYQRFYSAVSDTLELNNLIDKFIYCVQIEYPDYYQSWDNTSFIINDFLQPVFLNLLKKEFKEKKKLDETTLQLVFQSRIIKTYVINFLNNTNQSFDDEIITLFIGYVLNEDREWFMNFSPLEYHMGVERWIDKIPVYWDLFMNNLNTHGKN